MAFKLVPEDDGLHWLLDAASDNLVRIPSGVVPYCKSYEENMAEVDRVLAALQAFRDLVASLMPASVTSRVA